MADRVLICGSRTWYDLEPILDELSRLPEGSVIIHGAARGADSLAGRLAENMGFEIEPYPVSSEEWKTHGELDGRKCNCGPTKRYCWQAGHRRNKRMLEEGKPDRVIAFQKNKSRGTANMIAQAEASQLPVTVIEG